MTTPTCGNMWGSRRRKHQTGDPDAQVRDRASVPGPHVPAHRRRGREPRCGLQEEHQRRYPLGHSRNGQRRRSENDPPGAKLVPDGYDVDPGTELIVVTNKEDPSALDMLSFATFLYEAETGPLLAGVDRVDQVVQTRQCNGAGHHLVRDMKTGVADCRTAKTQKPEECEGPVWGMTYHHGGSRRTTVSGRLRQ